MKSKSTLRAFLLGSASLLAISSIHAGDGTWILNNAGNWNDPANWSGGTVADIADGTDFTAFFTTNITADRIVTLDTIRTIGNITFTDSTTSSHNLTISGANILTLDVTSGAPVIDVTQTGRRLSIGSQIAGADGLTKNGVGIAHLTSNNTNYTGATTVNAGMLDFGGISNANIGGGVAAGRNISVASGAIVRFNALSNAYLNRLMETTDEITVMTGTTSNAFDFSSSTGATLPNAFLSNFASNGAKAEISGIITPGGGAYRLGAVGQSGALGIRQESLLSGTNQLIIGGNRVVIVGAHTFTGDTTIRNGGRLGLAAFTGGTNSLALQNSALDLGAPAATGQIFLEAGSTAGPITGANVSSPASLALGTVSATFGGLKGSKNLVSAFVVGNTGNNTAGTALANITGFTFNVGTGNTFTYSGAIGGFGTGASGGLNGNSTLTKTGDGTQILEGTNTYSGATTVSAGILSLGTTGSINNSVSLAIGASGTFDVAGSYAIPASQPIEFGIDATGAGSSGKITAATLDITNAVVTYNITGPLDDAAYVLATYTPGQLTGTFASVPAPPSGYTLDYAYQGNKIALVSTGGAPEIAVEQPALTDIANNGSKDFGTVTLGSNTSLVFTIRNSGTAALTLNGSPLVDVTGANFGDFTVTANPSTPVAASGTTTFTVQFTPGGAGVRNAALSIANDDADENPFVINISGTGQTLYQAWPGSAPFANDSNGDGVKNGLAFLLGAPSANANAIGLLPTMTQTSGNLVLTFSMLNAANRGSAVLRVQFSNDMGVTDLWSVNSAIVPNTTSVVNGVSFTVTPAGSLNNVTATIPAAKAAGGKLFGRLDGSEN